MSAPPIPGFVSGAGSVTGSSMAWDEMWERMGDGEWHRGLDLTRDAAAATGLKQAYVANILAHAARAGLLEKERRSNWANRGTNLPPVMVISSPKVWYRRPAGAPCP